MTWSETVEAFLCYCRDTRGFKKTTVDSYRATLLDFARRMASPDPEAVTVRDLDAFLAKGGIRGTSANTRRTQFHGLKSFFRFCATRGFITRDPTLELRAPRPRSVSISTLTKDEMRRLIFEFPRPIVRRLKHEPDDRFNARSVVSALKWTRDNAMFGLAYTCGLRAAEIGHLTRDDFYFRGNVASIVIRNAKKARESVTMRVHPKIAQLLGLWIGLMQAHDVKSPWLFPNLIEKDRDSGLTPATVRLALQSRIEQLGIKLRGRRISPHIFRYSIASHLYESKIAGIVEIQKHMRHSDPKTTMRYIRLSTSPDARIMRGILDSIPALA